MCSFTSEKDVYLTSSPCFTLWSEHQEVNNICFWILWHWFSHQTLILCFWLPPPTKSGPSTFAKSAKSPWLLLCHKSWIALSNMCIPTLHLSSLLLTNCHCLLAIQTPVNGFPGTYHTISSQGAKAHDWWGLSSFLSLEICSWDKISTDKRLYQIQQLPDGKTRISVTILRQANWL